MKRSSKVVLLITGSVVLAACRHQASPPAGTWGPLSSTDGTSSTGTSSPVPSTASHSGWWWHRGGSSFHWFGGGSSRGSSSSGGSASHVSGVSRGGFGGHGSSSS